MMPSPLDPYIPRPDVRERFHTIIRAPAALVMDTACTLDLQSLPLVRGIFWLRAVLMRAQHREPRAPQGLLAEMLSLGWSPLVREEGLIVCGAACQPWRADAEFTPIATAAFASYDVPNEVKIAWTLETEALGPTTTRFSHETRVVATDEEARIRFRQYWRWARFGIIAIRLLLMPAVRRTAERRWPRDPARLAPPAPSG
jgi:hypothetical protein